MDYGLDYVRDEEAGDEGKTAFRAGGMTLEEARKVAEIIAQADGNCSYCVEELRKLCQKEFPQFTWTLHEEVGCGYKVVVATSMQDA